MVQTLLTVLLLATAFLAGLLSRSVRRVAVPLAGLTAAVMVVNFITARVAGPVIGSRSCFPPSWFLDWYWGWHGLAPEWPAAGARTSGQGLRPSGPQSDPPVRVVRVA
jgi:hypothetical protein